MSRLKNNVAQAAHEQELVMFVSAPLGMQLISVQPVDATFFGRQRKLRKESSRLHNRL